MHMRGFVGVNPNTKDVFDIADNRCECNTLALGVLE